MTDKNTLIELLYDDELVLQASNIYESGAVRDLVSLDANLYICKVADGKNYEVEIQAPFTKKQKTSCECAFFSAHNICKHVIAGLMLIREQKKTKLISKETKSKESQKNKLSTLNITQMLEEISHEELKSFVKAYTKRDVKFATQFKVNFARKIDTKDNAEKYKNILNSIIKPHTGQSKTNASDIKSAIKVLQDFSDQVDDCIALKQYREALDIFMAAFAKLEYVKHYYNFHAEHISSLSEKYHQTITYFLSQKLPQELRLDLMTYLCDLAFRSYYHYSDINHNIVKQLLPFIKSADEIDFIPSIEKLINERQHKELSLLIALWIICQKKYTESTWQFIKEYTTQHIEIADHLLSAGEELLALKCLESMHNPKKVNREVINRLVFLYVRFKNKKKTTETARLAYLQTGDLRYIDILKKELDDTEYYQFIWNFENTLSIDNADPNLLIKIYKKEENWSGMILFLDKIGDLELVMQNDTMPYKHEKTAVAQLYIHIIKTYLDQHLGDTAFEYLTLVKNHFNAQKMDHAFIKVKNFISEAYTHRPKLIELFS